MFSLSGRVVNIVKKTLDSLSLRTNLIASNIANADTPGYKSVDIKFDEQLSSMIGDEGGISMATTSNMHFASGPSGTDNAPIEVAFEITTEAKMDGNNVDVEREMVKAAESQITYSALVQGLTKKINMIKYAIAEGRRG